MPTGVVATATGPDTIDLSWTASTDDTGVAGYNVYRDGTLLTNVTTGTTYQDLGLTASTAYSYTVSAFDAAANESAQSNPAASATTMPPPDTTAPSVPAGVVATATGPDTIDLSWTASTDDTGVAGYHLYRDGIS